MGLRPYYKHIGGLSRVVSWLGVVSRYWGPGSHCWSFIVYYPLTGAWGNEGGYCAGPNDVVGIAGPVANGTYYAIGFVPNNNLHFNDTRLSIRRPWC